MISKPSLYPVTQFSTGIQASSEQRARELDRCSAQKYMMEKERSQVS